MNSPSSTTAITATSAAVVYPAKLIIHSVSKIFHKLLPQLGGDGNLKKYYLLLTLIAGIPSTFLTFRIMGNHKKQRDIKRLQDLKQGERKANFNSIRTQLKGRDKADEDDDEILEMDFETLQSELQDRRLTARHVVEAFIRKCLELANNLNCVTEFALDALEKAEKLDHLVLIKGPLHGMPFCLNDDIDLQGTLPSFSCSMNLPPTNISSESAVMVKVLESLGAIPICRASTSVICTSFGGRNPYFGEVHNPLNKKLSVGGSSCGTACLVQAGGVPFGVGTDRAGGARLPAHLCGITTLKSSRHRISRRGCVQHCVGTTSIPCIMTKRVNDLCTLYGLIMDRNQQHRFDPKVVPLPWNVQVCSSKQKLRIGCFKSLPTFAPLGDTQKALEKAKFYLESCGHLVIDCEPPDDLKCQEVWTAIMKAHTHRHNLRENDKYVSMDNLNVKSSSSSLVSNKKQISPRILWAEETKRVKKAHYGSSCWKGIFERLEHMPGRKSSRDRAIEQMHTTMNSDCDLWNTASLRELFVDEVLDTMNANNVDVIICPVFGHMATTPEKMIQNGLLPGVYTFLWNLLDLPAGVLKVWKEGGMNLPADYEESIGMPLGIQVVGRPFTEEMVLRVMIELDEINDTQ